MIRLNVNRIVYVAIFVCVAVSIARSETLTVTQSGTSGSTFGSVTPCGACDAITISQMSETFTLSGAVPFTPSPLPLVLFLTENPFAAAGVYSNTATLTVALNGLSHTFILSVTDTISPSSGMRTLAFDPASFLYSFADGNNIEFVLPGFSATAAANFAPHSNPDLTKEVTETLTFTLAPAATPVPEPSSFALFVAGSLLAGLRLRAH